MLSFSAEHIGDSLELYFDNDLEIAKDCLASLTKDVHTNGFLFKTSLSDSDLHLLKRVAHRWKASFKMFGQFQTAGILDALEKSDIKHVVSSKSFQELHDGMVEILKNLDQQLLAYDT